MTSNFARWIAAPFLLTSLGACGGATPEPVTPVSAPTSSPASASEAPSPAAVPATWSKDLTKDQQMAFMKKNVAPSMGPVFQGFNASRYANFGCTTCHGPEYKDPHDYLPRLTLKDGRPTAFADKPEVAKFMATSVVPHMASAMGLPAYDEKTKQGFGCAGCHAIDSK